MGSEPEAPRAEPRECALSDASPSHRLLAGSGDSGRTGMSAHGVQCAAMYVSVLECYVNRDSGLNISQLNKQPWVTSSLSLVIHLLIEVLNPS